MLRMPIADLRSTPDTTSITGQTSIRRSLGDFGDFSALNRRVYDRTLLRAKWGRWEATGDKPKSRPPAQTVTTQESLSQYQKAVFFLEEIP